MVTWTVPAVTPTSNNKKKVVESSTLNKVNASSIISAHSNEALPTVNANDFESTNYKPPSKIKKPIYQSPPYANIKDFQCTSYNAFQ